jgi:hypothetical protein
MMEQVSSHWLDGRHIAINYNVMIEAFEYSGEVPIVQFCTSLLVGPAREYAIKRLTNPSLLLLWIALHGWTWRPIFDAKHARLNFQMTALVNASDLLDMSDQKRAKLATLAVPNLIVLRGCTATIIRTRAIKIYELSLFSGKMLRKAPPKLCLTKLAFHQL